MDTQLTLIALPDHYAVNRLDAGSAIPHWAVQTPGLFSVTRTADELSVVCGERHVPASIEAERGWRGLKLEGPFPFNAVGVLKSVLDPLAEARVGIFAISTFDTDYVLVKTEQFEHAVTALTRCGHTVRTVPAQQAERMVVKCSWRLPDGARTTASYAAEVIEYDAKKDRWLMKLTGVRFEPSLNADVRRLIEAQVGKWAFVPSEARQGLALPLKFETLTGRVRFFYAEDPRQTRAIDSADG
jgi:hypothetical protein